MSKIKNGGLDQYGAGPVEQQQFGTAGVEGANAFLVHSVGLHRLSVLYNVQHGVEHNGTAAVHTTRQSLAVLATATAGNKKIPVSSSCCNFVVCRYFSKRSTMPCEPCIEWRHQGFSFGRL